MRIYAIRNGLWLGFFGLILWSWWFLYQMAIDMDLDLIGRPGPEGEIMRNMDPHMNMYMPMAEFGPLFFMWVVMMAAMMLPTMIPTLRTYSDLIRNADGSESGWVGLILMYSFVWVGVSAVFTWVQLLLLDSGMVDMLGIARSPYLAGGLLIAAGMYQFTRIKEGCHNVCQSPIGYFLGHWRPGFVGGLQMGAELGLYCVLCCWGFMALGFVGGVMNLLWMGLATLFMVMEKLQPIGRWLLHPVGAVLIISGIVVIIIPFLQGG